MTASAMTPEGARIRLLVAEDEWLIADLIASALDGSRFAVTGQAGSVGRALRLMEKATFDAAVLDANLAGELSQPVAQRLGASGVPFLVLTAYQPGQILRVFGNAPVLAKPFAPSTLVSALEGLLVRPRME